MNRVSGFVVAEGTKSKIKNAVIKATAADGVVRTTVSDEHGYFTFDEVVSGEWSLLAMKEGYFPSKAQKLDLVADRKDVQFDLAPQMEKSDAKAGQIFFYCLIGGLVVLIIAYIVLHLVFPQINKGAPRSFLWGNEPYRFLEVLFWGVAGVLVEKLMSIGYYLRRGTFYRSGILMHISHIVSVPLLTLVVVFLLSLVELSLTLSGNEVKLDLSDPRVLVAVSFIMGSRPWSLRDFVQRTAEKMTRE